MANTKEVNYKPMADDPQKSCRQCKHFKAEGEEMGDCFGHKVLAKGTCNFFEPKSE